jgi:hypothetical protein
VQRAAAASPGEWRRWWWICVGGEALLLPFLFVMRGRWSPGGRERTWSGTSKRCGTSSPPSTCDGPHRARDERSNPERAANTAPIGSPTTARSVHAVGGSAHRSVAPCMATRKRRRALRRQLGRFPGGTRTRSGGSPRAGGTVRRGRRMRLTARSVGMRLRSARNRPALRRPRAWG